LSHENFSHNESPTNHLPKRIALVLVDRDGTLIERVDYLSDPNQVKLFPGTIPSLRTFAKLGLRVAVITNQSGIGRGLYSDSDMNAVNDRMLALFQAEGVGVDGIFYCPHTPDEHCSCRKPGTGLAQNAADQLGFDVEHTVVIGDNISDIEMGWQIGVPSILVQTGLGNEFKDQVKLAGGIVVADILQAALQIEKMITSTSMESPDA